MRPRFAVAALAASALALGGTADTGSAVRHAARPSSAQAVVREWSRLVNTGREKALAPLFRLPAIVEQGGVAYRLKTAEHVRLWHEGLPCAGRVRSVAVSGRFATAVFVLGTRPGHRCDATGELAAARFEIEQGKIVRWTQVEVPVQKPEGPSA